MVSAGNRLGENVTVRVVRDGTVISSLTLTRLPPPGRMTLAATVALRGPAVWVVTSAVTVSAHRRRSAALRPGAGAVSPGRPGAAAGSGPGNVSGAVLRGGPVPVL